MVNKTKKIATNAKPIWTLYALKWQIAFDFSTYIMGFYSPSFYVHPLPYISRFCSISPLNSFQFCCIYVSWSQFVRLF
jgi:hypothetical protein